MKNLGFLCVGIVLTGPASAQSSTENYTYDVLGRLVVSDTAGGQNNNETHSTCFDRAGNRTRHESTSNGSTTSCLNVGVATQASGPSAAMTFETTTLGTDFEEENAAPVTQPDEFAGKCLSSGSIDVTENDSDPDGEAISLTSVAITGGAATAFVLSGSSIQVSFGPEGDVSAATYEVIDPYGETASGNLQIIAETCGEEEPADEGKSTEAAGGEA